jgi:hypothetical protein
MEKIKYILQIERIPSCEDCPYEGAYTSENRVYCELARKSIRFTYRKKSIQCPLHELENDADFNKQVLAKLEAREKLNKIRGLYENSDIKTIVIEIWKIIEKGEY